MASDETGARIRKALEEVRGMNNRQLAELLRDEEMMGWTKLLYAANNEALARILEVNDEL